MTIDDATNERTDPLPDLTAERLLRAALTLSRMPAKLARSIDVVDLDGPAASVAAVAARIAQAMELVPFVTDGDTVSVRFERRQ